VKVSFLTLGCRVNQSESSIIEGTLEENGVTVVNLSNKPDFCVVNTCAVTSKGEYNSRQLIRRAARSGAKVIVTGCYAHLKSDNVRSMPGVYDVVDNSRKLDIVKMIAARDVDLSYGRYSRSRPYLKIQDGCNSRCSYCTVPLARGKSKSIAEDEIIERVNIIESRGYNEVVLTGIHLGTYGRDLPLKSDLKKLLRRILLQTRIKRIRLSSLEINEVDEELTEILFEDRMCKHLHLPLQSGSDRILKLMRRGYESSDFITKVETIASRLNNISLGSDVIAGFPGERDDDFKETVDVLRNLPLSYIHVFPFSPRAGTDAVKMSGEVDDVTVKGRLHILAEVNRLKRRTYMERQIGIPMDIILEEAVTAGVYTGTSGNYLKVRASVNEYKKGNVVYVRPVRISEGLLDAVVMV
jgi:threonylcarbamoyladenosine tRNA methylthiotransferase MtaB